MGLRKQGKYWYGDSQADIAQELKRYGELNEYTPTHFADPECSCGSKVFRLRLDNDEGAAIRSCSACGIEHAMGDSEEYLADATLDGCTCVCGGEAFEITVGVSLYEDSNDVRWLYVGCRCVACGLTGCYGDWKNEFLDYRKLLDQI